MPSHSSSSHSSHSSHSFSGGSRSSSSFRSSSSRSYSSPSRSYSSPSRPSSHSSSSHSSISTGGPKMGSSPRVPSARQPAPYPGYIPSGQKPYFMPRPRINQPIGWIAARHLAPRRTYYGVNHTYVYYPESWTSDSGQTYNAGYYDENGTYYSDVSFKKDDTYENLTCHCDYCGTDTVVNCKAADTTALVCSACGAPLSIRTQMDEMTAAPVDEDSASGTAQPVKKKKRSVFWKAVLILAVFLLARSLVVSFLRKPASATGSGDIGSQITSITLNETDSNLKLFGRTVKLVKTGDGLYRVSSDAASPDKQLNWVAEEESYYDPSTGCYIWYNTAVTPNVWQYWFDGISSDFASGWMEYDEAERVWYIETDWGEWQKLPGGYDTSKLWHIE